MKIHHQYFLYIVRLCPASITMINKRWLEEPEQFLIFPLHGKITFCSFLIQNILHIWVNNEYECTNSCKTTESTEDTEKITSL